MKKELKKLLESHDEIEQKIRHSTRDKALSTEKMTKLEDMEQSMDLIKERMKQLSHVTVIQMRNTNQSLMNTAAEKFCDFVEAMGTFYAEGAEIIRQTVDRFEDIRSKIAKRKYELTEQRFQFESRSTQIGNKKEFQQIIKKKKKTAAPYWIPWKRANLPLLHVAAKEGRVDMVNTILEKNHADTNDQDEKGNTALFFAIIGGHDEIVSALYQKGAEINHQNLQGNTPLHIAVQCGKENCLIGLLKYSEIQLSLPNNDGETPLSLAYLMQITHSQNDSFGNIVMRLLEAGAERRSIPIIVGPTMITISAPVHPYQQMSPLLSSSSPSSSPTTTTTTTISALLSNGGSKGKSDSLLLSLLPNSLSSTPSSDDEGSSVESIKPTLDGEYSELVTDDKGDEDDVMVDLAAQTEMLASISDGQTNSLSILSSLTEESLVIQRRRGFSQTVAVAVAVTSNLLEDSKKTLKQLYHVDWSEPFVFNGEVKGARGHWSKCKLLVYKDRVVVQKRRLKEFSSSLILQCFFSGKDDHIVNIVWQFKNKHQKFFLRESSDAVWFHRCVWWSSKLNSSYASPEISLERGTEKIQLFIGTWNVGNAMPDWTSFDHWISRRPYYDLYVINLQESEFSTHDHSCEAEFSSRLQQHLGKAFVKLVSVSLGAIRLFVMIRRSLYFSATNLMTRGIPTGVAGVMANKGGVGISFKLNDTTLCFIGSHLAAHQGKIEQRNENQRSIIKGLTPFVRHLSSENIDSTLQSDIVFWMGDLNYRIDMDRDQAISLIREAKWEELLKYDQLSNQIKSEASFLGFREGPIDFPPTYKYEINSRDFYTEEKQRVPSWCDRILWKNNTSPLALDLLQYNCCDDVVSSDHHPVYSIFNVFTSIPPPPFLLSCGPLLLRITGLRIEGLRFSDNEGTPRPFLKFFSRILIEPAPQTTAKKKTRSPSWEDETIDLQPNICDVGYLSKNHISVLVCNKRKDKGQNSSKYIERYAQTSILIPSEVNQTEVFSVQLTSAGYGMCGTLFGAITMVSDPNFATVSPLSSSLSSSEKVFSPNIPIVNSPPTTTIITPPSTITSTPTLSSLSSPLSPNHTSSIQQ